MPATSPVVVDLGARLTPRLAESESRSQPSDPLGGGELVGAKLVGVKLGQALVGSGVNWIRV
jgi:hypothetical protein